MARERQCYKEVLPFTTMAIVELANVVSNTIYKAATMKGMSYLVFIVYSYAVSAVILLPLAFLFHRRSPLPPLDISLFGRIFFLGILGFICQILRYKGIEYGSPTLASGIGNLIPAFTFLLAIIFRMEKASLRKSTTHAKIIGTVVLISGAFVMIFYKGPSIVSQSIQPLTRSAQSSWIIGGLLLISNCCLLSLWYIIQVQIVKKCPAEFFVLFLYSTCQTIISTPICLFLKPNLSTWKIGVDIAMVSIIYTGVVAFAFSNVVLTWAMKIKGPVYVTLFKPLSVVIAAVIGFIFLGEALYLGSVVGAITIAVGFFVVMWGKANEDIFAEDTVIVTVESPSPEHLPLLQGHDSQKM